MILLGLLHQEIYMRRTIGFNLNGRDVTLDIDGNTIAAWAAPGVTKVENKLQVQF